MTVSPVLRASAVAVAERRFTAPNEATDSAALPDHEEHHAL